MFAGCAAPVIPAAHAGAINGKVTFDGRPPAMRPIQVSADPGCAALHAEGAPLLTEFMVTGEGSTMANVLVRVTKGLPADKVYPVPAEPVDVTQKDCRYGPHVFVARVGQPIRFSNPDGLQHNVHPLPAVNREMNRAMSKTEREFTHTFTKPEAPFKVKCDVHAWMEAYCAVVDHPFYAVTGPDGTFTIEGLQPGEYEIEAWHEVLGTQRAKVTVTADTPAVANFTFTRPQKKP
jgi:plastocyanin